MTLTPRQRNVLTILALAALAWVGVLLYRHETRCVESVPHPRCAPGASVKVVEGVAICRCAP